MRRLAFLLLLLGCERPAAPPAGRVFTDSRGKSVVVPARPGRIVTLVPSATELLYRVGAAEQIAGVTTACDWPPEAKAKPKVGGVTVDLERVLALKADLVVTCVRMTRRASEDLEARGLPVYSIDPASFAGIAEALRRLGEITGRAEAGAKAAEEFLTRAEAVKAREGPTVYFESSSEPMGTTGADSYTGEALRRAGGRNVFEGGWRLTDWEGVLARDPEVMLIAHDRREGIARRAGWSGLKAVKTGRVHFVAPERYVYPTFRLLDGLEEAARLFHEKNPR